MQYRNFGKLKWKASALGFGLMRLPTIGGDHAKIDDSEAIRMIRYAIDHGVNYVDTAYPYHGGTSEAFTSKVLKDGYREKVKLATKMPTWLIHSRQDMDKYFDEQLQRLQMDCVDFYLIHGLNKERWQKMKSMKVCAWAEKKIDEGKISYFGFSFHDELSVFKEIVDDYDGWTLCQIQYNYADADYQAGTGGLKYAASRGLAVVIMEPLAGGRLGMKPPNEIEAIWNEAAVKRTPAEWALQWVWNQPEVSVVLSGMNTMEQVKENIESANRSEIGILSEKELGLIRKVRQKSKELGSIGCTGCAYCTPCSEGVSIPDIIALYNEHFMKERSEEVKKKYLIQIAPENRAKKCIKCGKCEELCPQNLPIRDILSRVVWVFESDD